MGETKIEWTTTRLADGTVLPGYSFNPWWGCTKVSQGCKHCYAETLVHRWGKNDLWGPQGTRRRTSDANWRQPLKWEKQAAADGVRRRVFCASMADVFEDNPGVEDWRHDLYDLIESTPNLIWLLLTKRPENVLRMTGRWNMGYRTMPDNVWIGTSVEDNNTAESRIPHLLQVPARVRFLSVEPLLESIHLAPWLHPARMGWNGPLDPFVNWVIVGGESGPGARPMKEAWVRSIQQQCADAHVPFFFKQICDQYGRKIPYEQVPVDLQTREFPHA